ncbi:hypothetical protein Desaci_0843 [Desulfosporosinus acidiphilus SJ4]|uniref:Uncharacterized protein n=1 Tax=Desulfosporosinus acidiphilus (strain DSM 22704 / JCM 16185 / SJ4) TaxID=646529 RepID=I4D275_DESAJ|nr:hypothetical protein [Desulfosporosinus acidiphilus]AFM39899.1 hypothetical protein Desaci_0843 [Desulfosporosinus acidiphilus SJ4]
MLTWISMIMLVIFLGCCTVVIAASCYNIFKLIRRSTGKRDFAIRNHHLKTSHG